MLQRYYPYWTDERDAYNKRRRFIYDNDRKYNLEVTGVSSMSEIRELIGEKNLPRSLRDELFALGWCRKGERKKDTRPDIRETLREIEQLQSERGNQ